MPVSDAAEFKHGKAEQETIIRRDSTVFSEEIYKIPENRTFKIIDDKYEWYKVIIPKNMPAYVYSEYLKISKGNQAKSATNNLNVRSEPNLKAPIIGRLKKDDWVTVYGQTGKWSKIEAYPYCTGWIHKKNVKILPKKVVKKPKPEPEPEPEEKVEAKVEAEVEKEPEPEPAATGTLRKVWILFGADRFRLQTEADVINLQVENPDKLEKLVNKKVKVWGKLTNSENPLLKVEKIELVK